MLLHKFSCKFLRDQLTYNKHVNRHYCYDDFVFYDVKILSYSRKIIRSLFAKNKQTQNNLFILHVKEDISINNLGKNMNIK